MAKSKGKPAAKAAVKKGKAVKSAKSVIKAKPVAKKVAPKAKVVAKKQVKAKAVVKKVAKKVAPKAKVVAKKVAVKAKPKVAAKAKPIAKAKPVIKSKKVVAAKPVKQKANKVAVKAVSKTNGKSVVKPVAKEIAKQQSKKIKSPEIIKDIKPSIDVMQKNELPKLSTIQTTHSFTKQKVQPSPSTAKELNPDGSEKSRYSDKELKEFKDLIVAKIENAKSEFALLQQQLNNANENGTDDTGGTFKMLEDGSETLAKEEAAQLAARQRKFIEQLESALIRIENKSYGICRVTGKLIPKERLKAVPHTTQSIEAKLMQYKDQ